MKLSGRQGRNFDDFLFILTTYHRAWNHRVALSGWVCVHVCAFSEGAHKLFIVTLICKGMRVNLVLSLGINDWSMPLTFMEIESRRKYQYRNCFTSLCSSHQMNFQWWPWCKLANMSLPSLALWCLGGSLSSWNRFFPSTKPRRPREQCEDSGNGDKAYWANSCHLLNI